MFYIHTCSFIWKAIIRYVGEIMDYLLPVLMIETTANIREHRMFQAFFIVHAHWGLTYPHDDVIKWKPFPHYHDYWLFVWGIYRSPVNSPYKGQWRGALMFSLICTWINGWVNNGEAGDLRHCCTQYDVTVMHCPQKQRQVKQTVGQMDFGKVFSYTQTEKKIHHKILEARQVKNSASCKFGDCDMILLAVWTKTIFLFASSKKFSCKTNAIITSIYDYELLNDVVKFNRIILHEVLWYYTLIDANTLELHLSCTNPSTYDTAWKKSHHIAHSTAWGRT